MKTYIALGLIIVACLIVWMNQTPTGIEHRTHQLERQLEEFELKIMLRQ